MEPTRKSPKINEFLSDVCGKDREETIRSWGCTTCDRTFGEGEFKDDLSVTEYRISGMCQQCQDSFWVTGPHDDD